MGVAAFRTDTTMMVIVIMMMPAMPVIGMPMVMVVMVMMFMIAMLVMMNVNRAMLRGGQRHRRRRPHPEQLAPQ